MAIVGPRRPSKPGCLLLVLTAILLMSIAFPKSPGGNISKKQATYVQEGKELVNKTLPYLSRRCDVLDQKIYSALVEYATSLLKPDWIKTEDDLFSFFQKRDSFIKLISYTEKASEFLFQVAYDWAFTNKQGDWERYNKELAMIGIRPVFAEGMLLGFTEGPVLEDVILRVASEPCRLYILMKRTYAESYGREYTYMDLEPEIETIRIGEELLQSFPESKYARLAKEILSEALFPLTDFHRILPDVPSPDFVDERDYIYIVGELYTDVYPWWTEISEHLRFLELYPSSRFRDIVAKIVNNPSEVIKGRDVCAVVVDQFDDKESARQMILSYLLQGLDIPHALRISGTSYAVAYRFFPDPGKAQTALEEIKKIKPDAKIRIMSPKSF